jgi:hypothetical protein
LPPKPDVIPPIRLGRFVVRQLKVEVGEIEERQHADKCSADLDIPSWQFVLADHGIAVVCNPDVVIVEDRCGMNGRLVNVGRKIVNVHRGPHQNLSLNPIHQSIGLAVLADRERMRAVVAAPRTLDHDAGQEGS